MRFRRARIPQALAAAIGLSLPYAHAQVVHDGTMGPPRAITPSAINSPRFAGEYRIRPNDGQQVGGNLFHSFTQFDIAANLRATFQGPAQITNIISRGTGGTPSSILGGLRSEIAGANLFLLNPHGIFFGANASLDLSGSFYASTAHHLELGTSGRFDAANPAGTVLTSAPPSAFGFLGPAAGVVVDRAALTGANGKGVTFVAGPLQLSGAAITAPGGVLNFVSVGGPGVVTLTDTEAVPAPGMTRASIDVINGTGLSASTVSGFPAGRIVLRGGRLTLQNAIVGLDTRQSTAALGVTVEGTESLSLQSALVGTNTLDSGSGGPVQVSAPVITMEGSAITSQTSGTGPAGSVNVSAVRTTMTGGSFIASTVLGMGNAGSVTVAATESLAMSGASGSGLPTTISSLSNGAGRGGDIVVVAPTFDMTSALVSTSVSGSGPAGNVSIQSTRVTLNDAARIASTATGEGRAGNIGVSASESIRLTGSPAGTSSIASSTSGPGAGGGIALSAPTIQLASARLNANSTGPGHAGDVVITTTDLDASFSLIDASASRGGAAGNVALSGTRLLLRDNSYIDTSSTRSAPGRVDITAGETLTIARGRGNTANGETGVDSTNSGPDAGSPITLVAPMVVLDGGSIRTRANDTGSAGAITVQTSSLNVLNGGQIDSSSFGAGAAGAITVTADQSFVLRGRDSAGRIPVLFTAARAGGNAGDIVVRAPAVEVDAGVISADAFSTGAPGNISIDGQTFRLLGGGVVSSSTRSPAAGAALTITATESVTISGVGSDGARSTLAGVNEGAGGATRIVVNSPVVTLDSGGITTVTSGAGAGGSVRIEGGRVALLNGAQISMASSGSGASGDLNVIATESIDVSGTLGAQPSGFFARALAGGTGGTVTLNAPTITFDGGVMNVNATSTGAAGRAVVSGNQIQLIRGGSIDSSTSGDGVGGRLEFNATEAIVVSGRNDARQSAISNTAGAAGSAGETYINAPRVTIDGGLVTGETGGPGRGGLTRITTGTLELLNNGRVLSTTSGPGTGGRLEVIASERVQVVSSGGQLQGAGIIGASSGGGTGGAIDISAPQVDVAGGSIAASALRSGDAGNITVNAQRVVVSSGGIIDSSSLHSASAGRILIDAAERIEVSGSNGMGQRSQISSIAGGTGQGGEVLLRTAALEITGGLVRVDAANNGIAGRVFVDAGRVVVSGGGQINSSAADDATGGEVRVFAADSVIVAGDASGLSGGGLFATTNGSGRGGEIAVAAPVVAVAGGAIATTTGGRGNAGNVSISGTDITISRGGLVDSSSLGGTGAGGSVNLNALRAIEVRGQGSNGVLSTISSGTLGAGPGGDIALSAPDVAVTDALIRADTQGRGSAGRIAVEAQRVVLSNGGQLASGTSGAGRGGLLTVNALESLLITGSSGNTRSRITNSAAAGGDAGGIFITAPSLVIENEGFVRGTAAAGGNAGNVTMRAGTLVLSSGGEISTSANGSGRGGSIDIVATASTTLNNAAIRSTSSGSGDAGSINIDAGRSLVLNGSRITTEAKAADGGDIDLRSIDLLRLDNSEITTSVGTGRGNGGNIRIDPTFVILDSSRIIANAFGGDGGNISITTGALIRSGDSVIQASSQFGVQGTIRISAPDSDLAGGLTPLPGGLFDPSQLLRQSCSARAGSAGNSFTGVGHGGLPARPGALAFSQYAPADNVNSAGIFSLAASFSDACAR